MLSQLAQAVRRGSISAESLVIAALRRVAEDGRPLGAVTAVCSGAVDEARALDRLDARQRAALPLAGLPLLVKDIEDVRGWPTTFGSVPFADASPAARDSTVVARLRAAGAIVVGRANTCEFAFEGHCDNRLHGPTHNPWNTAWSSGGSSGGSAAALAAGVVPLATASDGGGSARIPASLCGLLGLKPTNGLVGSDTAPAWLDFHTDAVLATEAEDLALLLGLLAAPAPGDPGPGPAALRPSAPVGRLVVVPRLTGGDHLGDPWSAHLRAQAAALASALGARLEHTTVSTLFGDAPELPGSWEDDWYAASSAEQAHLLGADVVATHADAWDPAFRRAMEDGLGVSTAQYLAVRRRGIASRRVLDELLTPGTLLVTSVLTGPGYAPDGTAPGSPAPGSPAGLTQTVLANITGHPALALPAGVLEHGLPWGLQVIAGRWEDRTLLEVARRWQAARPWPATAPGYAPFAP